MTTKTASARVPAPAASSTLLTDAAISKDGTRIGYYQLGRGPALIILHGSVEFAKSHLELAEALADTYTVILPDRRGRGLSGAYRTNHSIQTDVEDMDALLTKTGARYVMGVSSGAVIWLKAMLSLSAIQKAVIFEPPLSINGHPSMDFLPGFDQDIAAGRISDAMVSGMLAAEMGPPIFQKLPRWFLKGMTSLMMMMEDRSAKPGDVTMRMMAPITHYDFALVKEMADQQDIFKAITANVLLLGGSDSPAYLKKSVRVLEGIIPGATRVEIAGGHHGVTGNAKFGGQPAKVAEVLKRFFG